MALPEYSRVSFCSNLFPLRFSMVPGTEEQLKCCMPIRACNWCSSTLRICDRIYYLIVRSYAAIFPLRPCFKQCRSLMVHVIKGEFQAQNKRSLSTVLIWFTQSGSGVFIMSFVIVFLNDYFSLSASLSPILINCLQASDFFSPLFAPNSDHPEKHITCKSWIPQFGQNIIKNR